MNTNQMKNIIVLKDLPSNLIDEAFVILKNNKQIKSLERVDSKSGVKVEKETYRECIVKEAEMIISNYVSKIENEKQKKSYAVKQMENKYKKLKAITIILGVIVLINLITNLF